MKIVFANAPDELNPSPLVCVSYPINISYLARIAEDSGHHVEMWDFAVEPLTEEYIIEKIKHSKPDVVGITSMTASIYFADAIARAVKKANPSIITILGGVHVTILPTETLDEFPSFDFAVITEAEELLPALLESLENKIIPENIPGTAYRRDGLVKINPASSFPADLDKIPYPHRELVPPDYYTKWHAVRGISRRSWNVAEITSSRGCPFSCTFCNVDALHGQKMRYRTPENVIGEIEECVKKFDANFVMFNESTFAIDKNRAKDIVKGLPKNIKGYYVCSHVNIADYDLYKTMADTGCTILSFGVESGSDRVLKKIQKNATGERIIRAFSLAKQAGIPNVEGTYILGASLDETEEDFAATERIIKKTNPDFVGLGIIVPFPGTPQYLEMKKLGYLDGVGWDQYQIFSETPPPWRIKNFSNEELVEYRNKILKAYYWNPRYFARKLMRIRDLGELKYYASMAGAFYRIIIRQNGGYFDQAKN